MFEPGLMDQLAEIIAYIGKHFHLCGREGTENPFGVFVKHLASELDFQQDVNGVLCVDPGRLNPVVEILCRMTESPLPEEERDMIITISTVDVTSKRSQPFYKGARGG